MAQADDWKQTAFSVYRLVRAELVQYQKQPPREELQYYMEELAESLLDLKQATIAGDGARAMKFMAESLALLSELRSGSRGGE